MKKIKKQEKQTIWIWPAVIIAVIVLSVGMFFVLQKSEQLVFSFSDNKGMWQVSAGTTFDIKDNQVDLKKQGRDFFVVVPDLKIDGFWYDVCVIELMTPMAYDQGHLLFISPINQSYESNFGYDFDTGRDDKFNKIWINLTRHGAWQGNIREVLIILGTDSNSASIKSIRFIHGNFFEKIKAWWGDFSRYYDPRLGSCFVMASPFFVRTSFTLFFLPFYWWFLGGSIVVYALLYFIKIDARILKVIIAIFILVILLVWGLLDLRNNVYYLKSIGRNISLYWGKSLQEKRGIITGNQEFIDFMKFVDENIPLRARVFNHIAYNTSPQGHSYFPENQFNYNLRPRLESFYQFSHEIPKRYYVVYGQALPQLRGTDQTQMQVDAYLSLKPGQTLRQKVVLWNELEDIDTFHLDLKGAGTNLEVKILDKDGVKIIADGDLFHVGTEETVFKLINKNRYTDSRTFVELKNHGRAIIEVGISAHPNPDTGLQDNSGSLFLNGAKKKEALAFRLSYLVKNPQPFKKFNEHAYILMK